MKRTCQYCDSPLLETDTVCWHCGRPQSLPHPDRQTYSEPEPTVEEALEAELAPAGTARTLLYAGLTLIVTLILLLVMYSLGQSPVMVYGATVPEGEWVYVKEPNDAFSIEIPAAWQWQFLEEENRSEVDLPELVAPEGGLARATRPLADLVPDMTYMMIAHSEDHLLVVARSDRLNRLTPQQAAAALPSEQFSGLSVAEASVVAGSDGESRTYISLRHQETTLACDQHLVPGATEAYLVAVCTIEDDYREQQNTFAYVLNSFSNPAR